MNIRDDDQVSAVALVAESDADTAATVAEPDELELELEPEAELELAVELELPPDDEELDELPHAASATTEASVRNPVKTDLECLLKAFPPPERVSC